MGARPPAPSPGGGGLVHHRWGGHAKHIRRRGEDKSDYEESVARHYPAQHHPGGGYNEEPGDERSHREERTARTDGRPGPTIVQGVGQRGVAMRGGPSTNQEALGIEIAPRAAHQSVADHQRQSIGGPLRDLYTTPGLARDVATGDTHDLHGDNEHVRQPRHVDGAWNCGEANTITTPPRPPDHRGGVTVRGGHIANTIGHIPGRHEEQAPARPTKATDTRA